MICIDPVGAALEASGTIIWLLCSWLAFKLLAEAVGTIPDRLDAIDVSALLGRIAKRIWRWAA